MSRVVLLEDLADLLELAVGLRIVVLQLVDLERRARPGHDVLALGVHQVLAVEDVLAGRRVAGEGDARAGILAHVAEDHHLDVDGRAPGLGDAVQLAVGDGPLVVPGAEDGPDRAPQLLARILGEVMARFFFDGLFEPRDEVPQVGRGQLHIALDAALALFFLDDRLERIDLVLLDGLEPEDDVAVHLDEAAIRIVNETGVPGLGDEGRDRLFVEPQVQDGVHHPGHRGPRPAPDGDEERIGNVAEVLPDRFLELFEVFFDLGPDFGRDAFLVLVEQAADFGRYGESRRDGQPEAGHLGQVGALSAKKILHFHVPFGGAGAEEINVLMAHASLLKRSGDMKTPNYTIFPESRSIRRDASPHFKMTSRTGISTGGFRTGRVRETAPASAPVPGLKRISDASWRNWTYLTLSARPGRVSRASG